MSRGVICDGVASNPPLALSFPVFLDSLFFMFLTSQTPTCLLMNLKCCASFLGVLSGKRRRTSQAAFDRGHS